MRILLQILLNALAIAATAYILPGVHIAGPFAAVVVAIVLGVLNAFLKPILIFLTLPATIITLGLFIAVINAVLVLLAARLVPGFAVEGFWWALLFSIIVGALGSFFEEASRERPARG